VKRKIASTSVLLFQRRMNTPTRVRYRQGQQRQPHGVDPGGIPSPGEVTRIGIRPAIRAPKIPQQKHETIQGCGGE